MVVDDGTAVIDCEVKHPRTRKHDEDVTPSTMKGKNVHKRPPEKQKLGYIKPPALPVGTSVGIEGRIIEGRGSRFLRAESHHLGGYLRSFSLSKFLFWLFCVFPFLF